MFALFLGISQMYPLSMIWNVLMLILSANYMSVFLLQLLWVRVNIDSAQIWFAVSGMSIVAFLILIVEMG